MKKKVIAQILALALCLSLLPSASAADTHPASSNNKNKQDYATYGNTVKSYLYENQTGGLTRVEYINNKVVVEDYDSSFQLQTSIYGAYTKVPFDAGSLRCAEEGGYLYIHCARTMHWNVMTMYGLMNSGANVTGGSLGGFEETSSGYVSAYNYDGTGSGQGDRDVYLGYTDKNSLRSTSNKVGSSTGTTPVLVSTGLSGGYIMWNGKSGYTVDDTLYYASYDAKGSVGQIKTATASLSDCQPICYNGKVAWYTTSSSTPVFYTLDDNGVTAKTLDDSTAAQILTFLWRAAGKPVSNVQLPVTLPASLNYAEDAIRWAAEKGMIDRTFDPNAPCTRASSVTYIWQAFGSPPSGSSGFSDVPVSASYHQAVAWAVDLGVTNGNSPTTFGPDDTCTRGQIVTFLYRAYAKAGTSLSWVRS